MKINILTIALTITTLIACQNTSDKNPSMSGEGRNTPENTQAKSEEMQKITEKNPALFGKWQGTDWLLKGQNAGLDATQVNFEFKEDGTFQANYAEQHKSGTWRTEKDSLYTRQTGMKELPIKLLRADGVGLEIEMNVKGNPEVIKFKKKQ